MQIEDLVGSFALTVSLPAAASYGAERASSEDQVTWTSSASGLQIENTVRRVAVQVEVHDGSDAGWQPATKVGPNGVALLPADQLTADLEVMVPNIEVMRRYQFRARVLVAASGFDAESGPGNDVVVTAGPYQESGTIDWPTFEVTAEAVAAKNPPLEGVRVGRLQSREKVYGGAWSEAAEVTAKSNVRFALKRVSERMVEGGREMQAQILVTKLVKGLDGSLLVGQKRPTFGCHLAVRLERRIRL